MPDAVPRQDFVFNLVADGGLVFFDQRGFKRSGSITKGFQFKGASGALELFFTFAVVAIGNHFLPQLGFEFAFQRNLGELFNQWG